MCSHLHLWSDWSVHKPRLSISDERIPFLGSNSISFLSLPVNAALSTEHIKDQIQTKLERYLHATDQSPLSHQQKLRIYKDAILPRLSWLLSLTDLPLSWIEHSLEPQVTKLLNNWCGLSQSADPSRIFLSRTNGGLGIPPVTTCYKKAQLSRYSQLMTRFSCRTPTHKGQAHTRSSSPQKK